MLIDTSAAHQFVKVGERISHELPPFRGVAIPSEHHSLNHICLFLFTVSDLNSEYCSLPTIKNFCTFSDDSNFLFYINIKRRGNITR